MTFALWVGRLIQPNQKIILVTPEGKELESIIRLTRIGYDNVLGFVQGGVSAWKSSPLNTIDSIEGDQFKELLESQPKTLVLDVR
jgi:hydroxyacylglutathione hydrolase